MSDVIRHKECLGVRGVKTIKCRLCGKESHNYANGIDICPECSEALHICTICGGVVVESFVPPSNETHITKGVPISRRLGDVLSNTKGFDTAYKSSNKDRILVDYNGDRYIVTCTKVGSAEDDINIDLDRFI